MDGGCCVVAPYWAVLLHALDIDILHFALEESSSFSIFLIVQIPHELVALVPCVSKYDIFNFYASAVARVVEYGSFFPLSIPRIFNTVYDALLHKPRIPPFERFALHWLTT
jgi:hypothetical protein